MKKRSGPCCRIPSEQRESVAARGLPVRLLRETVVTAPNITKSEQGKNRFGGANRPLSCRFCHKVGGLSRRTYSLSRSYSMLRSPRGIYCCPFGVYGGDYVVDSGAYSCLWRSFQRSATRIRRGQPDCANRYGYDHRCGNRPERRGTCRCCGNREELGH